MVYWQPDPGNPGERKPSNMYVIAAAMNVVMIDLALLSAEMTAGIYRKPIDEIAQDLPIRAATAGGASGDRRCLDPRRAIAALGN